MHAAEFSVTAAYCDSNRSVSLVLMLYSTVGVHFRRSHTVNDIV
jgi:hypothetical protein